MHLCLSSFKTSSSLRDIANSRTVWIAQLAKLDNFRPPNLPPHIDVTKLSTAELRQAAITAAQDYEMGRFRSYLDLELVQTIWLGRNAPKTHLDAKFSPGGRFLFVLEQDGWIRGFDLDATRCRLREWEFQFDNERCIGFDVGFHQNGCLILALATNPTLDLESGIARPW